MTSKVIYNIYTIQGSFIPPQLSTSSAILVCSERLLIGLVPLLCAGFLFYGNIVRNLKIYSLFVYILRKQPL